MTFSTAFRKDPASVSDQAIDDLIAELEPGPAQGRGRPAYGPGACSTVRLDLLAPSAPRAPASARSPDLVALKTRRCLDRGDVERPLRDLAGRPAAGSRPPARAAP